MKFYAVALDNCPDCFFDFELDTFGDGINKNNLLPSRSLAESMAIQTDEENGVVIEVDLHFEDDGIFLEYDDIWS